ncbi:hypothetical protein K438DRAFT_1758338 [Mycena galopus ATCC 62051]|nr:hypothetical protein K438DRAFT_1758338 [Mycena galopus ATCC 62051]
MVGREVEVKANGHAQWKAMAFGWPGTLRMASRLTLRDSQCSSRQRIWTGFPSFAGCDDNGWRLAAARRWEARANSGEAQCALMVVYRVVAIAVAVVGVIVSLLVAVVVGIRNVTGDHVTESKAGHKDRVPNVEFEFGIFLAVAQRMLLQAIRQQKQQKNVSFIEKDASQ